MTASAPVGHHGGEVRPSRSISTKLAVVMIATALVSVLLVSTVGIRLIRQATDRYALLELRREADSISSEAGFFRSNPGANLRFLRRILNVPGTSLYRMNADHSLTLLGGSQVVALGEADFQALSHGQVIEGSRSSRSGRFVFVAEPMRDDPSVVLVLGHEVGWLDTRLPLGRRILWAALIAVAAAALFSVYLSQRITTPMRELASAVSDVAKGNFERRVTVESDDEVGVVASSFNRMAEELGQADKRQREFFLSISHELRTPLTAIQGYAEAIEDGTASNGSEKDAAAVIVAESKRLTRLVSDVLDLARIDASRFQVTIEDLYVEPILKSVVTSFAPKAEETGVQLQARAADAVARADPDRLKQVLSNLVENALRYTPAGEDITLSATSVADEIVIDVIDGGLGIEAQDLDKAFDRQYLWGKYKGVRDVGTGLGLAITKELVEAMGGSVGAARTSEGGARFSVRLPKGDASSIE